MSDIAIRVEHLSKQYQIGKRIDHYATLRDQLAEVIGAPVHWLRRNGHSSCTNPASDSIWALKDVSFQIERGEVVGIIGQNGAGKSTLLKILSRITEPTEGYADIFGRVGSLLEVGTGFHPELTGRENIYLNGAILGMKRAEIHRKFDEIVSFAEVEQFVDTPVKRYSSGMYVRLAFAVAAHLDPDILLVDEVLAVGDAAFQKKCLGRMGDVAKQGRTVLFVSHNMAPIISLCRQALLLRQGTIAMWGPVADVVSSYQNQITGADLGDTSLGHLPRKGTGKSRFVSLDVVPASRQGDVHSAIVSGSDVAFDTVISCSADIPESNVAIIIYDSNGYRLIDVNTAQKGLFLKQKAGQKSVVRFNLRQVLLRPGTYYLGLWIGRGGIEEIDSIEYARRIDVVPDALATHHTEIFPAPYLCKFDVALGEQGT